MQQVLGTKVHTSIFNQVQRVAKAENISVSRLLKKCMFEYAASKCDKCLEIFDESIVVPSGDNELSKAALKKSKEYLELMRVFSNLQL